MTRPLATPPLIIGCGNADRGDDAAGLLVVRRLRALGLEAIEQGRDGAAMMEAWSGRDDVVIVDAVVTGGGAAGTITVWDARDAPVIPDTGASSHGFGLAAALQLGRILGRIPPRLTIYGIEGRDFDIGTPPSPEVAAAVERLARSLAAEPRNAA